MSGKMRPALLNQVLEELNIMERQPHPALGKAKRDCIRELVREKLVAHQNAPLTLEELRGMDQERVWVQFCGLGMYALVAFQSDPDGDDGDDVFLTNNLGGRSTYEEIISDGGEIYRRPPEE